MAAILCNGFANLCNDCCHCLTLPCRACCDLACSPFVPYLGVTLVLNIPLVVWGMQTFSENASACDKAWWLWANAVMAAIHIVASFYIVHRIQNDRDDHHPYYDAEHGYHAAPPTVTTTAVPVTTAVTGVKNASPVETKVNTTSTTTNSHSGNPFLDLYNKVASTTKSDSTIAAPSQQATYVQPIKVEAVVPAVASPSYGRMADDHDDDGPAMSWHRLSRVLCYDAGVALYILVVITWVIWQTIGITALIGLAGSEDEGGSCRYVKRWIVSSTMCGWIYMMVVFCAFGCSLICLR
jgi:hypothetical protein